MDGKAGGRSNLGARLIRHTKAAPLSGVFCFRSASASDTVARNIPKIYIYAWGNNERRATLKGRRCVIEARGALGTVLVRFLDTGERVTTSRRALRVESFGREQRG
jgi:hypothetical protein